MLDISDDVTSEYFTEIITDMCIDLDNIARILESNNIDEEQFINGVEKKFVDIGEKDAENMNRIMDIKNMNKSNINMYRDMILNSRYNNIPDNIDIEEYWDKGFNNYLNNIE